MIKRYQDQNHQNSPPKKGKELGRVQPFGEYLTSKKKQANHQGGKKYVGDQRSRLNFIAMVYIFGFAQEFNHRVSEQTLFDGFNQCENGQEQSPDAHFLDRREYLFCQNDVGDDTKGNQGKPVKEGEKNRMDPKRRSQFEFQVRVI